VAINGKFPSGKKSKENAYQVSGSVSFVRVKNSFMKMEQKNYFAVGGYQDALDLSKAGGSAPG
jgi:hypothetical protein